ncbi:hypothetical protein FY528_11255 [Hymenobacter lutimineralis]|uniref:CMP/dCMP-type deaminase domain-containing protein n=1 Tax=Hymenobacter lutimineralis TaxID=2606448 RepID=A0A5D6V3X9_9BACT|nr:ATP-binding protein [Hymenobacter lutimineralis]TYZ09314.1 hypothetical protein FY528_11255 [Hymenobacter lutimineralis]
MSKKHQTIAPRVYMEMAIAVMKKSIQEPRNDKASPKVGAVLIMPDGTIETACRGELRYGDHAEFTLLERKKRSELLEGSTIFATLEPCAPGARKHPKLGCAERIVNARIKTVWIGVEDPDPTVDRKGIKYLIDNGVEVKMFDPDLQVQIWAENTEFKRQAEARAKQVKEEIEERNIVLSEKEKTENNADLDDLSEEEINQFIRKAQLDTTIGSTKFNKIFTQLGLLENSNGNIKPTGIGLLLFGNRPQLLYQNALIRATFKTRGRGEEITTIEGPITHQADKAQQWYETHMASQIDRSTTRRTTAYDFPLNVFREAIINAVVHRDYDIEGAPIYLEINDDAVIIKSPGTPVPPLTFEDIKSFTAPSLSRNPKIMYAFDQLELVEHRGLGFQTIKELPEKFGLPLPVVSYDAPYMIMKFPRNAGAIHKVANGTELGKLNHKELAGYHWLATKGEASKKEYAEHFKIDDRTAQRHLSKMRELNIIGDNGERSKSPNLRYTSFRR